MCGLTCTEVSLVLGYPVGLELAGRVLPFRSRARGEDVGRVIFLLIRKSAVSSWGERGAMESNFTAAADQHYLTHTGLLASSNPNTWIKFTCL